ncbi:MAG: serpin family protein [Candidatus Marinimicrobia bacterium]|nr:serpin family protein [Candidatus Neomarinimicrobiota bacterium]
MKPPNIIINRPFVFAILENHSNAVLFLVKIVNL